MSDKLKMISKSWICQDCGVQGTVEVPEGTDIHELGHLLFDSHYLANPVCRAIPAKIVEIDR